MDRVGVAPWLLIGLLAGGLIDRWSRTTTMIIFTALRAPGAGCAATRLAGWWLSVPLLLVVAGAAGVATVFATLAEQALVPELVAPPDRREAKEIPTGE